MPGKNYTGSASSSRDSSTNGVYYNPRDTRPVPTQTPRSTSSKKGNVVIVDDRGKTYDDYHRKDQYPNRYP